VAILGASWVDKRLKIVFKGRMSEIIFPLLAIAMVLALVSLLLPVAERLRVPHTVLVAVCGMGLGFVSAWVASHAAFSVVVDTFDGLHRLGLGEDVFLALFLPPLLFTAGLTIDVRRLLDEFWAVLLLAIVAVLVCIGVVGGILHLVTGTDLVVCLLLGAIVSTTDPAAVIGVFRDVGAPKRLSILAEGEALFNDAAAIAAFGIFLDILVAHAVPDAVSPALHFLREFLGGVVFGYATARVTVMVLPRLSGWDAGIASVTVSLAYLTYIVGGIYLHVSGVVAVVVAALTMAAQGPTHLHPRAWTALRQTWVQLEFWSNSLIFVLASMLAADVLLRVSGVYIWGVASLVVGAFAARALVLFGLLPMLISAHFVQPIDFRYKSILVWGGLRGAVTVVLALVVAGDQRLTEDTRQFISVLATLFVMFTLLVNAPSLRLLIKFFRLDKLTPTELAVRDRVLALSRATVARHVREVARSYGVSSAVAEQGLLHPVLPPQNPADKEDVALGMDERLQVGLLTLAAREKELYLEHFEQQTLSRRMVAILAAGADRLSDRVKTHGVAGYEFALSELVRTDLSFRVALWLHRRLGWEGPLSQRLADRFESLMVSRGVLSDLADFNRSSLSDLLGPVAGATLATLLDERRDAVDGALKSLSLQYSGYGEAIRDRHLQRAAIRFELAEYTKRLSDSTISREVYADLRHGLAVRRAALDRRPPLDLGLELVDMIGRVSLFTGFDRMEVAEVGKLLRALIAVPDEKIVTAGQPADAMYFIAAGEVTVLAVTGPVVLREGEFFGEMGLLSSRPRNASVVSTGYCHLLVLSRRDFRKLLAARPALREQIEEVARRRLAEPVETASAEKSTAA
jgi:monovalent cation:H+ antiporter, CPA1 family